VEDHKFLNKETEDLALHAGMLFFTTISMALTAFGIFTSWFCMVQSLFLVAAKGWMTLYSSVVHPRIRDTSSDYEIGTGPRARRVRVKYVHSTHSVRMHRYIYNIYDNINCYSFPAASTGHECQRVLCTTRRRLPRRFFSPSRRITWGWT
jgi:hypothetical protein